MVLVGLFFGMEKLQESMWGMELWGKSDWGLWNKDQNREEEFLIEKKKITMEQECVEDKKGIKMEH